MEKVKLPREVVECIERFIKDYILSFRTKADLMERLFSRDFNNEAEPLDRFVNQKGNLIKLAQAIEFGYEVEEPEIKIGDFIHLTISDRLYEIVTEEDMKFVSSLKLRHATPEEIVAEKKRRFWAEIGREVDEYKTGDIVMVNDEYMVDEVMRVHEHEITIKRMNGTFYKQYARLVCPIEQRLDTKG